MSYRALPQLIVRTPTLPFDVLATWADQPDRRAVLRALVGDPVIREALYVASPELDAQIATWLREPESQAGVAVERALVRYISRMAGRSTPFGLFSAVSVGSVGETRLQLAPRAAAHRHTRLDNDFLFALCADLGRDPFVRGHLRYRTNTSLYQAAGRLRYAEARLAGPVRTYHLVAVDRTPYLDALLARATAGATLDELIAVLTADPDIATEEAGAFIHEVIDAQLLVAELAPAVTGREPTLGIAETLASLPRYAEPLRAAHDALHAIDTSAPGQPAEAYRAVEQLLAAAVPTKVEANRLFQVDLFKPPTIELGAAVVDELRGAIELLHKLAPPAADAWSRFRQRFTARYETREVPLVEVLDEEVGIGFGDDSPAGARVAGEHGTVQLERVLARGFDQGALRERKSRRVQHLLQARVLAGIRLRDRRGGGRLRSVRPHAVPRFPDGNAPGDEDERDEEQAPASPAANEALVEVQLERRREGGHLGGAAEQLVLVLRRQRGREIRAVRPALGRIDEIADALGRGGLVQEAEDDAFRDERGEFVLVVAPARDDDREVRELLVDLGDEGAGVVVGERGVDQQHGIARGDHEVGRVRRVIRAPDAVMPGDRVAQQVDEDRVGRQDDDVRAARARQCRVRAGRAGGGGGRGRGLRRGHGRGDRLRRARIQRIRGVVARQDVRIVDVHVPS